MHVAFLVNTVSELSLDMATALLIHRARAQDHRVWVCGVEDLEASADDRIRALARSVQEGDYDEAWLAGLRGRELEPLALDRCDLVWIRTNPARDAKRAATHRAALRMLQIVRDGKTTVLNDPSGLMRASSKLYLNDFPTDLRPQTLVSSNPQRLRKFVESTGPSVLKPLEGTHGQNVFKVDPRNGNLSTIITSLLEQGPTIAQELVPGAEGGDIRVLLVKGEPLSVGGEVAAVRRVPGKGEFRSNIHAGGRPERALLDGRMKRLLQRIGPRLREDGIFFAGIDVISGRIIEINVFSPGGLADAEVFFGVDFAGAVVEAACKEASGAPGNV